MDGLNVYGLGLENCSGDNNCFLNVIIQSLWHIKQFRAYFSSDSAPEHKHIGDPCVICALFQIFSALNVGRKAVDPIPLRFALSKFSYNMRDRHDASEVLEDILKKLHESSTSGQSISKSKSEKHNCLRFWGCDSNNCLAHELFGMDISEEVYCDSCDHHMMQQRNTYFLRLINACTLRKMKIKGGTGSFDELLKLVEENEHQSICGGCRKPNQMKYTLQTPPHVFIIVLCWHSARPDAADVEETFSVLTTEIDIGNIYQFSKTGKYRLLSVVCYRSEHYSCFIYSREHKQWIMFDDISIKPVGSWDEMLDCCEDRRFQPNILFFEAVHVRECLCIDCAKYCEGDGSSKQEQPKHSELDPAVVTGTNPNEHLAQDNTIHPTNPGERVGDHEAIPLPSRSEGSEGLVDTIKPEEAAIEKSADKGTLDQQTSQESVLSNVLQSEQDNTSMKDDKRKAVRQTDAAEDDVEALKALGIECITKLCDNALMKDDERKTMRQIDTADDDVEALKAVGIECITKLCDKFTRARKSRASQAHYWQSTLEQLDTTDFDRLLNAIIQSLWHVRRFWDEFMARAASRSLHKCIGISCSVCAIYVKFFRLRAPSVAPTSLRTALHDLYEYIDFFEEDQIRDASEVLEIIFDDLHRSFAYTSCVSHCTSNACLVHTFFQMNGTRRTECTCGVESKILKYNIFHRVDANELGTKLRFGHSSLIEYLKLTMMNSQESALRQRHHMRRTLSYSAPPYVYTMVLDWKTTNQIAAETISATLTALSPEMDIDDLYPDLDSGKRYCIVSVICYRGRRYCCIAYSHNHGKWVMYGDDGIEVIGQWKDVIALWLQEPYLLPEVLFFETATQNKNQKYTFPKD